MPKKQIKKVTHKKYNFTPVSMFFIIIGVIFFVLGLLSMFLIKLPSVSVGLSFLSTIGGTLIMVGGYTNLELGLIRKELEKK